MTVREAISDLANALETARVDEPDVEARWIASHLLQTSLSQLQLNAHEGFPPELHDEARNILERRKIHEPLQHILGSVSFCGIELEVSPAALIPRPETEGLAECAWNWLNEQSAESLRVLDIGTGTGCLSIAISQFCPQAQICAVDISPAALELARRNAATVRWGDRIRFLEGNVFEPVTGEAPFDLIISNPPYIPIEEMQTLQIEVREYDPELALVGGVDGLDFYRVFAQDACRFLARDGRLMCEFGDGQATALAEMFGHKPWICEEIRRDLTDRPRFFVARCES
jgi:release factor glutamine methyltransferase